MPSSHGCFLINSSRQIVSLSLSLCAVGVVRRNKIAAGSIICHYRCMTDDSFDILMECILCCTMKRNGMKMR